ncbi:MAG: hypothetical protein H0A75_08560 [Candidatus Methanofishera endochildressiae]|uniref:Uncharacterized protein n=1 Tax=Candidatus Methanofishera endochildressiae TaxID=2738884 RepID=A0A7Z0SDF0_9GAMM|nr:hypothetical protein [Candidatus Methanofishera endochildressiae]
MAEEQDQLLLMCTFAVDLLETQVHKDMGNGCPHAKNPKVASRNGKL